MSTINEMYECLPLLELNTTEKSFFGIECEIEGIRSHSKIKTNEWTVKEDGSLRNSGLEYVTPPVTYEKALESFQNLHTSLVLREDTDCFSERTSIHVHLNCGGLEESQVKNLLFLYAIFEPLFFRLVKEERINNIHCVPLEWTHLSTYYGRNLDTIKGRWSKYTAFNISPLSQFGTVEFRHMHGTNNYDTFKTWLTTIDNLFYLCQNVEINRESLSNKRLLQEWFTELFGHTQLTPLREHVHLYVQNSLLDVKLAFV